jgi:hypothetical protein
MNSRSTCYLGDLPTEIVQIITSKCYTADVMNLWFCGSRVLIHKLSAPLGVAKLEFIYRSVFYLYTFPLMTSLLQGLQMIRVVYMDSLPFLNTANLGSLPKTLRTIDFEFIEAEECWLRSGPFPHAVVKRSNFFDWNAHFPRLSTLKLNASSACNVNRAVEQLQACDIATFPPCLETLHLPWNDSFTESKNLPPNVTDLEFALLGSISTSELTVLSSLPLHRLSIHFSNEVADEESLALLPHTLTALELPGLLRIGIGLCKLPRGLLHLNLAECTSASPSGLPPALTSLRMDQFSLALDLLPKNLTSLTVKASLSGPDLALLPPLLQHLTISSTSVILLEGDMMLMPRKLKTLRWEGRSNIGIETLPFLPPELTHFTLCLNRNQLDETCFLYLPKSLTVLDVGITQFALIGDRWWTATSAAKEARLDLLKTILIDLNFDVDLFHFKQTPAQAAAEHGHLEILRWLVKEQGADLGQESSEYRRWTCTQFATKAGHLHILEWMVSLNWSRNLWSVDELFWTLTHIAAANGRLEVLQWLVFKGRHLGLKTIEGDTEANLSAKYGHIDTLKSIVSEQGTVDLLSVPNNNGFNVAHCATSSGHLTILQWLKEIGRGALFMELTKHGANVIHLAAEKDSLLPILRWLHEQGFDMNMLDFEGHNAAWKASTYDATETLSWLKSQGFETPISS